MAQAEGVQPLGQVLRQIGTRYPGRALDAELIEREGPPLYRIKWLGEDGKVREVRRPTPVPGASSTSAEPRSGGANDAGAGGRGRRGSREAAQGLPEPTRAMRSISRADGEEGHYLGANEPYDAVVLDLGLPVVDGITRARALAAGGPQHAGADPDRARPLEREGPGLRRRRRRLRRQAVPHGGGAGAPARAGPARRRPCLGRARLRAGPARHPLAPGSASTASRSGSPPRNTACSPI